MENFNYIQAQVEAKRQGTNRLIEDVLRGHVVPEEQEGISHAIDSAIGDLFDRVVVKLNTSYGWQPEDIAELAGVTRQDVTRVINDQESHVWVALEGSNLTPVAGW